MEKPFTVQAVSPPTEVILLIYMPKSIFTFIYIQHSIIIYVYVIMLKCSYAFYIISFECDICYLLPICIMFSYCALYMGFNAFPRVSII